MDTQKTISVLNDLLHITNDRIRGFGNVEGKVWEMYSNLKGAYDGMITQSKIMRVELIDLITARGGEAEDTVSLAGSLHRTWINIKNSFSMEGKELTTLQNVVFGENAAIQAYQEALDSSELDEESIKIVSEQLHLIKESARHFSGTVNYITK